MNTSSYVRMGMSHFYFDPSSGYYWNGKEWLTREKYDEEVGKAWEVYNCTQAGAGIQQQQQQQYQQPVVPQPQYNIQHQQQQYYQQQQPVVLQQPQQGYYAAPQPPTGQDPYRNVVPQPQYNMQQQQQQWPIPQQPYHVAYQSAPPALLQQQHPASTNPYANIKQWIHRSLLSLTSSGCTDDEANALVAAKVEEVGENADWDNLPVCGSVVKPVEGNYGGGYNAGLAKRVREETVAPRAKKSRFDKAPPANVGVR
ncbi:hypothetical protein TL16_g13123 [Triparma laevis f. inornata]|uniref:Uncharacterized protein n=1 Tax=Triparma laevis f. inornata TaxID=1714386 RepID=A0A9W7EXD6_9STRA|nr:hypothetical protein TL16_g13123 [Triparma laevis f. inornata]